MFSFLVCKTDKNQTPELHDVNKYLYSKITHKNSKSVTGETCTDLVYNMVWCIIIRGQHCDATCSEVVGLTPGIRVIHEVNLQFRQSHT